MKLVKKITITVLLIFICIGSYFICSGYQMYKNVINKMPLKDKITTIRQKEDYTKIDDMPQIYLKAVVSVEDHRFYKHFGIDVISIGRAFVNDVKKMKFVEGGSTITQQLAKNMYYSFDKNIDRKIAEVFTAADLEKELTKNEILELYVNDIYFGNNQYGIRNASVYYYGVEPMNLSSEQIDQLVFTIKCPNDFNPNAAADEPQLLNAQ